MTRIISALLVLISSVVLSAFAAEAPLELAPDAPNKHVVVPGDTLWGISAKFLKDPFRWNELWKQNSDEVKNPHRIYPGQVLVLDMVDGQPRLRLAGGGEIPTVKVAPEVRITENSKAIPAIPQQVIEPFLTQPLVVEEDGLESAPRVLSVESGRVTSSTGDQIYVDKIASGAPRRWQVYRPGEALKDPKSGAVIGFEAILLGPARLVTEGAPASLVITTARQEIGKDDRLVPAPNADIVNYPLHRPTAAIDSRVVSIYGGSTTGGRYSIVAITGGKKGGIELGHVLALSHTGQVISDRYRNTKLDVTMPNERYGLLYVFRTFQNVSYALVMEAKQSVEIGDTVGTP